MGARDSGGFGGFLLLSACRSRLFERFEAFVFAVSILLHNRLGSCSYSAVLWVLEAGVLVESLGRLVSVG